MTTRKRKSTIPVMDISIGGLKMKCYAFTGFSYEYVIYARNAKEAKAKAREYTSADPSNQTSNKNLQALCPDKTKVYRRFHFDDASEWEAV